MQPVSDQGLERLVETDVLRRPVAVEAQASMAVEVLRSYGETHILGEDDGEEFWERFARRPWDVGGNSQLVEAFELHLHI